MAKAEKKPQPRWLAPLIIILIGGTFWGVNYYRGKSGIPSNEVSVVATFPHDQKAYIQGFVLDGENYYESTGKNGESSIRLERLVDGEILKATALTAKYFGEGLAVFKDKVYQITWKGGRGFIYDKNLKRVGEWEYEGEGWGLTHDGKRLIMSDGTHILRFLNPETMEIEGRIEVMAGDARVTHLNELEYIKGEIWANVWESNPQRGYRDLIVCIDPETGKVNRILDCSSLRSQLGNAPEAEVLNGIAYDAAADRIFLTGKLWPKIFEIKVKD